MRSADQTEYIVQCLREAGSMYEDGARAFLAEHDAHARVEVLTALAEKLDGRLRLTRHKTVSKDAIRRFLQMEASVARAAVAGEKSSRPTAEATPEAYDGELAMLRGLVRTLRVVVRPDDADMAEVRRLLWQHTADENEARGEVRRG
ncbi:hypothetical protein [Streptomyces ambofaciens]